MLEEIKGIGPKTLKSLNNLNVFTLKDLLEYYPYRYNFYKPISLVNAPEEEQIVINGIIETQPKIFFISKVLNRLTFKLNTGNELVNISIFNRSFMKNNLTLGKKISVIGKYSKKSNSISATDIRLNPFLKEEIEPVYHLNQGIKKSIFKRLIELSLNKKVNIDNYIPDYLMKKYNFIPKKEAINNIHFPKSIEELKKSKLMLIYEELFTFMLKINYLKKNNKESKIEMVKNFDSLKIEDLIKNLPFKLTNDQVNAIEDIKKDFNSTKRMNRLILGDVGSGKTIVSFIALYMNYLSGYQGVLMAPTEILTIQHYNNIKKILPNLNIALITSSTKAKERKEIIDGLKNNTIDIIIGTHSLLNKEIEYNNLGLVITDEQHRFGVNQRKILQEKGKDTDVLYMSATPIPRTLSLTIYGDMDISQIRTKPSNRKPIMTKLVKEENLKEVLLEMLNEIKQNHQIYVVAALIEEDDENNMQTVKSLEEKMNAAFNGKVPISLLHGKLKSNEKDQIVKDFKDNKTKILISTTVIEVGIDVENATMMVIFNAERFGLATLHQLRGRVGRNNIESKCILISNKESERLKVLTESNDGFYISEKDFELRGSGDLFGVKQSGEQIFKLADIKNDIKILMQCQKDSEEFLKKINDYPQYKQIFENTIIID